MKIYNFPNLIQHIFLCLYHKISKTNEYFQITKISVYINSLFILFVKNHLIYNLRLLRMYTYVSM